MIGVNEDEYGRPKDLLSFINKYNVRRFNSGKELEKFLDENYNADYYKYQDVLSSKAHSGGYGVTNWREDIKNMYTLDQGGTAENKKDEYKASYNEFLEVNVDRYNRGEKEAGKYELEVVGYYIGYTYCKIENTDSKEEYTPEDFWNYYEEFKNAEKGSKYQETAIQNMHDCFYALPTDKRQGTNEEGLSMAEALREAELTSMENEINEKPGNITIEIEEVPEETYEFDVEDWGPESTTSVKNGNSLMRIGNKIIGTITLIGSILSVITLIILGIKYMLGSVEEKAEYKKTLWPYFIGSIMVFGITNIINLIIKLLSNI